MLQNCGAVSNRRHNDLEHGRNGQGCGLDSAHFFNR